MAKLTQSVKANIVAAILGGNVDNFINRYVRAEKRNDDEAISDLLEILTNFHMPYFENVLQICMNLPQLLDSDTDNPLLMQVIDFFRQYPEKRYITDDEGNTLLHLAVQGSCKLLTKALVELDIAFIGDEDPLLINSKNSEGQTPLALAFEEFDEDEDADYDIINVLVDYNASFYLERDALGTYLTAQYYFTKEQLGHLLSLGQTLKPSMLEQIINKVAVKVSAFTPEQRYLRRDYLDRVALRLVGLADDITIDFNKWGELYANATSEISNLCTIDTCFKFGEQFGVSVNYLLVHVRALLELVVTGRRQPTLVQELLSAINTAKIDQETTLLLLLRLTKNKTIIKDHVNGLYTRIQSQALCYPGGWPGSQSEGGHAIYVDISKMAPARNSQADCYQISVYNLGEGIEQEYNESLIPKPNLALPAVKTILLTRTEIKSYLAGLVWANLKGTSVKSIDKALALIYDENIFGEQTSTQARQNQAEIIQPIGNCIVKNYLFAMRTRLGDARYHTVYLGILNITFEQMQSYCGILPSPSTVVSALRHYEVVFNHITALDIQRLSAFNTPRQGCMASREYAHTESTASQKFSNGTTTTELAIAFGLFKLMASPPVVYHHGQALIHEEESPAP